MNGCVYDEMKYESMILRYLCYFSCFVPGLLRELCVGACVCEQ